MHAEKTPAVLEPESFKLSAYQLISGQSLLSLMMTRVSLLQSCVNVRTHQGLMLLIMC